MSGIRGGRRGGHAGRGGGRAGRGNITMTAAEVNALIQDRVNEAMAAFQAGNTTSTR